MSQDQRDDDEPSTGRKIFGFSWSLLLSTVLSTLAMVLLIGAVCMPFQQSGPKGYFGTEWLRPDLVFAVYLVFAVWGSIAIYRRTTNPGVKWGCMTALFGPVVLSLLWQIVGALIGALMHGRP